MNQILLCIHNLNAKWYISLFCLILLNSCQREDNLSNNNGNGTDDGEYGMVYHGRNGTLRAYNLDKDTIQWQVGGVFASDINSIVYEDGVLYTCNTYGMAAVDAKTGNVKWRQQLTSGLYGQSGGIHVNHPVIKDSLIYGITFFENSGRAGLNCINKNTGKLIWKRDLAESDAYVARIFSTPAIVGDKIVANAYSNLTVNKLYGLNRFTGQELWRNTDLQDELGSYPFVLNNSQILYMSNSQSLYSLNPENGEIQFLMNPWPDRFIERIGFTKRGNKLITLLSSNFGYISTIDINNWKVEKGYKAYINSFMFTDRNLFVQDQGRTIKCLNPDNYSEKWSWDSPSAIHLDTVHWSKYPHHAYQSAIISDDKYVYDYENFFGSWQHLNRSSFYILNAETGKLIKEIKMPIDGDLFIARNFMILRKGKVYKSNKFI
ncbi:MAG: PQQ-binding-like beta-propeller repeat protein [Chitinophagaceae bacterium]